MKNALIYGQDVGSIDKSGLTDVMWKGNFLGLKSILKSKLSKCGLIELMLDMNFNIDRSASCALRESFVQQMHERRENVIAAIEGLIAASKNKGEFARFPERYRLGKSIEDITKENVLIHLKKLEDYEVSWSIQNVALMLVNEVNEDQRVWELLFMRYDREVAERILKGSTFNDLLRMTEKS